MRRDNFKHYYRFRAVPNHCRPRASRVIKAHRVTANQRPKVPKETSRVCARGVAPRCTDSIHKFLARKSFATHQPDLRSGDLYVFSSSRVHETFNVFGKKRVTLATFMAWPSWEATGGEVLLYQ